MMLERRTVEALRFQAHPDSDEAISKLVPDLPKKLKRDAIIEAIFEIRFDSTALPEVFVGRLADNPSWGSFQQRRMPFAEMPAAFRNADNNMRYQPTLELSDGKNRMVRIGEHVLAFHVLAPYIGWEKLRPELEDTIDVLFAKGKELTTRRLGLRYVNALTRQHHGITSTEALNLRVLVAEQDLRGNFNLNFIRESGEDMVAVVRVASPEFVEGKKPEGATVFVDVDVYTRGRYRAVGPDAVKEWLSRAHDAEKAAFFGLLKDETIETLRED